MKVRKLRSAIASYLAVTLLAFVVFCNVSGSLSRKFTPSSSLSYHVTSTEQVVFRQVDNGLLYNFPFKIAFFWCEFSSLVQALPKVDLPLVKALFVNSYQYNPFYIFTSIHAP